MCRKCQYLNSRSCLRTIYILTIKSSLCLHLTPLFISSSRYGSHSNIKFSASIQCRQNSGGWRRCGCNLTAPSKSLTSSDLHMVLSDDHVTLRSSPIHEQTWSPLSDYLGQRHTSHFGRDFQLRVCKESNETRFHDARSQICNYVLCPISYKMNYIMQYVKLYDIIWCAMHFARKASLPLQIMQICY